VTDPFYRRDPALLPVPIVPMIDGPPRSTTMTDSPAANALPVPFVRGLVQAIAEVMGEGGGLRAVIRFTSEVCALTYEQSPLWRYYGQNPTQLEPIDHTMLAVLRTVLDTMYGPRGGYGLSRRIGMSWWGTDDVFLLHPYAGFTLCDFFRSAIVAALRTRFGYPGDFDLRTRSYERFVIACEAAAYALTEEAQIICQVTQHQPRLIITFPACPFCGNTRAQCGILYGVVTGLLVWLFRDTAGPPEQSGAWYIVTPNPEDDHTIEITFCWMD
jgi:hypothetical protein